MVAGPVGILLGNFVTGTNYAFHNVVNVGEVSGVVSVIKYLDGLILEDVPSEFEQRHVGSTPWAINREET